MKNISNESLHRKNTLTNDISEKTPLTTMARGIWHRPNSSGKETNLKGICSILDEMQNAGINMVFVESFYHGMSLFKSDNVPYYTEFEKYKYGKYPDYLTAFSSEAYKRGIEVHAWVESFYLGVNDNAQLVKKHSNWLLVNELGNIRHLTEGANLGGYLFFDPANKEVQKFLLNFYDELLTKVPYVSGLNLDYVRYPVSDFYNGTDTGYTNKAMSEFSKKYGLTLFKNDKCKNFKKQIEEKSLIDEWTGYRANQVTEFISKASKMVKEKHACNIVSVAVHPDIDSAYNQKKQDFSTWIDEGYIDVITPMIYYHDTHQISSTIKKLLAIFKGVYCYTGLYTTYHDQTVDELENHINTSNLCGADGFVLFESVKTFFTPSHNYAEMLSKKYGKFSSQSRLPHMRYKKVR